MGAWGPESFANDAALDWLGEFMDGEDEQPLYDLLDAAVDEDPEVYLGEGEAILAAAEVVAAMFGRPGAGIPGELRAWAARIDGELDGELLALALTAVRRVRERSVLRELWEEGPDEGARWLAQVDELIGRLKPAAAA